MFFSVKRTSLSQKCHKKVLYYIRLWYKCFSALNALAYLKNVAKKFYSIEDNYTNVCHCHMHLLNLKTSQKVV